MQLQKRKVYTSIEELPASLNVYDVAQALAVSIPQAYKIVSQDDFPKIRNVMKASSKIIIPKDAFVDWMDKHTQHIPLANRRFDLKSEIYLELDRQQELIDVLISRQQKLRDMIKKI
jgi:hypothetical protein